MNAPVLALIGQIPDADIGRGLGQLHEIRDQAGIIARLVDHSALHPRARAERRALVAEAIRAMATGRPGPAALECAIDVWGKRGHCRAIAGAAAGARRRRSTRTRCARPRSCWARRSADDRRAAAARRTLRREVTALCRECCRRRCSASAAAGACSTAAIRFSVTLPLGRELWGEADVVLGGRHAIVLSSCSSGASTTTCAIVASMPTRRSPRACTSPRWR